MQEQMKNKILYTDEARCDLDSIWDYIALDLQNQQAAERLVNKIMDRVDQLEDFAESGMLLSSISEVIGEERFLVCENYLIFYHTGKSVVTVDRVLYGRKDYLSVLFDRTGEEPLEEDPLPENKYKNSGGAALSGSASACFVLWCTPSRSYEIRWIRAG